VEVSRFDFFFFRPYPLRFALSSVFRAPFWLVFVSLPISHYNQTRIPPPHVYLDLILSRDLLSQDILKGDRIRCELGDALPQFLYGHLILVEVESEERLIG